MVQFSVAEKVQICYTIVAVATMGGDKLKTVIGYIRPFLKRMSLGLSIKVLGTFCDLGIPWILAYIVDDVIPTGKVGLVVLWGLFMILCSLGAWRFNILANRKASSVARDVTKSIRHDLFERISYLSNRDVDKFTSASLISRMTSDTYVVHQTTGMIQRLGVRAPIILVGGIFFTLTLDPVLTLVMVATLPVAGIITYFITRKGVRNFRNVQRIADKLLMVVRENVTGIRVIKALSKSEYERKRFEKVNTEQTEAERKAEKLMAVVNPCTSTVLNIGLVLVILVGADRVFNGASKIGTIMAFLNYFTLVLQSIMGITRMFTMLSRASASADRIEEVLTCPYELYEIASKYDKKDASAPFIHFDNVDFKYGTGSFMLKNINIKINKGETLGIIGATGSGKSTLIQALLRFYDVAEGSIKIEGVDIRDYSTEELHSKFGVVFQNDAIFKETIRENITLSREISDEDLAIATKIARADAFIAEQGGFEAPVAIKGANLSGGQKQRLLISRAVAAKPEILILDDSSSALDYKTDAAMREQLREYMADTTKIIVAQRISSIMQAEQIIVMDMGEIIGMGTHEYLMETCPMYREISDSQIGGGEIE